MARVREFDPKEALAKALDLFWRKGYAETTMRDVVAYTGVAHAGLYSAFGSKQPEESSQPQPAIKPAAKAPELNLPDVELTPELLYKLVTAEIAGARGELGVAVQFTSMPQSRQCRRCPAE